MERKKQFKWFTIFEHEKEQDYLQAMHRSGWKLTAIRGFGMYHFEKCIPEEVAYRLDYNKDGLAHKEEYLKMFEDCGWEHIQEYVGYSYFRKPVTEEGAEEEIFCDAESRISMMQRVLKARLLPLLIVFIVFLPQFLIHCFSARNYLAAFFTGAVLLTYLAFFAICFVKYQQYKSRQEERE